MEKLTMKKKLTLIKYYLSGLSYDEIAIKCSVSKGTVANIVNELRAGKFPEAADTVEYIDLLRELSLDLRRSGLTPGQCVTGLTALTRINEYGLNPADIDRWSMILKSVESDHEAQEFVRLVYSIQEVQKKTGLSLEDLDDKVHELEKKVTDLEPVSKQYEDIRRKVKELTRQREELNGEVAILQEKHKLLNPIVKDLEKREQKSLRQIKDIESRAQTAEATLTTLDKENSKLLGIGLTSEALVELNHRLQSIAQHHDITPEELRSRLMHELETLEQGLGLETLIHSRQLELEEQERAVNLAREELESLKSATDSLKKERIKLEASTKENREKVSREMTKIVPAAKNAVNSLVDELRRGHAEALAEVRQLRDEALEVGKEVGRFEEIIQVNQWLNDLLTLIRGEETIEDKKVRTIVLRVLRGTAASLKGDNTNNLRFSTLSLATDNLIREMEQWKP